jgi:hypothetical protein
MGALRSEIGYEKHTPNNTLINTLYFQCLHTVYTLVIHHRISDGYQYVCKIIITCSLLKKNNNIVSIPLAWLRSSGQGGGYAFCSPKYIIKKKISS